MVRRAGESAHAVEGKANCMSMRRESIVSAGVFALLVLLAIGSRLADFAPNFAAVAACGLFAGSYFRSRLAASAVPLVAMFLSDSIIGFYSPGVMAAVYGAMCIPPVLGRLHREKPGALRTTAFAAGGSVSFFVITNFAVWLGGSYGYSASGLLRCFVAAIPFFKYTIAGDLLFTAVLFGSPALARSFAGPRLSLASI